MNPTREEIRRIAARLRRAAALGSRIRFLSVPPACNLVRVALCVAASMFATAAASARGPARPDGGPPSSVALASQIDAYIAQPQFARADWGIAVRSLDTGRMLYAHDAGRLFVPASNAKLFTAALALATLGPSARIATTLYATSLRIDLHGNLHGNLHGDLILYGRGDPSLGLEDASADWADRLAAALAQRGVKRVDGNLIADATYFSGTPIGGGWEANDLQSWFGAVPSALDVEGNLIRVEVSRDGRRCCIVTVTPDAADVRVVNRTGDTADDPMGLYRPVGTSTLYAIGHLPSNVRRHTYVLSIPSPARAAGNLVREAMARKGIELAGRVQVLEWPGPGSAVANRGTREIARIDSPTVAELVDHMLKQSDNLFAQALLLQVGVASAQRRGCDLPRPPDTSAAWGLCALRGLLAKAGIPSSSVLLADGSGLTRRDLVTPGALVQWLAWATGQPWGAYLRDALPVAGVDGTLHHRLRNGAAADNLRAKTGTLSHAYTLVGFVTDAAGERLVFSLMLNRYPRWEIAHEFPDAPTPAQALDTIARMLARFGSIDQPR